MTDTTPLRDHFAGFAAGKHRFIELPAALFTDLLPLIDDADELRVTLYAFFAMQQREGRYRYLRTDDFAGLALAPAVLTAALERACARGSLLGAEVTLHEERLPLYFVNTAAGRAAVEQIACGDWRPADADGIEILPERPNIYRLYEENIGVLTPIIAEALKDAEREFPLDWIAEALQITVKANALNWKYARAVLDSWRKEGRRSHEAVERPDGKDPQRFIRGELSDFIER